LASRQQQFVILFEYHIRFPEKIKIEITFVAEPFEAKESKAFSFHKNRIKSKFQKMKVTIDGQSIEVEPGTTILQAAFIF
jgi:hypothetical protein